MAFKRSGRLPSAPLYSRELSPGGVAETMRESAGSGHAASRIGELHMRLLAYFGEHGDGSSLAAAAVELGVSVADVARLAAELVAAGLIEPVTVQ